MKTVITVVATLLVVALLALAAVWSGQINPAADEPHSELVFHAIETARERAIAARTHDLQVPNLEDDKLLAMGAEHYAAMCTSCHLAPGMEETETRTGLYPQPPTFFEASHGHEEGSGAAPMHVHAHGSSKEAAARQFWIIKHGIKASGMPAWGKTHDDESIWGLVAFLQKLPAMSAEEYQRRTAGAGAGDEHGGGHHHHHGAEPAAEGSTEGEHAHEHGEHEHGADAPQDEHRHAAPEAGEHDHAHGADNAAASEPDSAEAVVDAFSAALARGDAAGAQHWLADDVLIYESGEAEISRKEYAAHHLGADMEFLGKAKLERVMRGAHGSPYIAWVTSMTRITTAGAGAISTETMVLTKEPAGWRIRHIHWSSRKAA